MKVGDVSNFVCMRLLEALPGPLNKVSLWARAMNVYNYHRTGGLSQMQSPHKLEVNGDGPKIEQVQNKIRDGLPSTGHYLDVLA